MDFEIRFENPEASWEETTHLPDTLAGLRERRSASSVARYAWLRRIKRDIGEICVLLDEDLGGRDLPNLRTQAGLLKNFAEEACAESPEANAGPFRYVLVKDLGKGAMSKRLLDVLRQEGLIDKGTQWFVSSKVPQPAWLGHLVRDRSRMGKIRLLLVPPIATTQEFSLDAAGGQKDSFSVQQWFIADKDPSPDAIKLLMGIQETYRSELVVAMPKGLAFLGVEPAEGGARGYCQHEPLLSDVDEELAGRASMFFAALSSELIVQDVIRGASRTREALAVSLGASKSYVDSTIDHLQALGGEERGGGASIMRFDPSLNEYRGSRLPIAEFRCDDELALWQDALGADTGTPVTGLVHRRSGDGPLHASLEVWRAMSLMDDYVETVSARRRQLEVLIGRLRDFRTRPSRTFSAHVLAKPGSGKSHLVSKLAAAVGLTPLTFDMTQMMTRQNVIACFEEISSAQMRDRERSYLAFFDEINALVGGAPVYDLFLSVLESGTYSFGGRRFKLDPCAWMFAGTEEVREDSAVAKMPDFWSRLTMKESVRLDRGDNDRDDAQVQLGFAYLAAVHFQLLKADIKRISAEVLRHFQQLPPDTSVREIRQIVGQFREIQYGEVRLRNAPRTLRDRVQPLDDERTPSAWKQLRGWYGRDLDGILVDVQRDPVDGLAPRWAP